MSKTATPAKLTPAQQALLDEIRGGLVVHYARYVPPSFMCRLNPNPYYLRADNNERCTSLAKALIEKGYAILDGERDVLTLSQQH